MCMSSELRQSRNHLLDIISNPNNDMTTLMNALNKYLGLLHGFIVSLDVEKEGGDSTLRHALRFRWTNTLLGNTPTLVLLHPLNFACCQLSVFYVSM